MKKTQIAISTIFVIVIAIASISFLLLLFSGKFGPFSEELYCKTLHHVHSSIYFPKSLRANPEKCEEILGIKRIIKQTVHQKTFSDGSDTSILNFENPILKITAFDNIKFPAEIVLNKDAPSITLKLSIKPKTRILLAKLNWETDATNFGISGIEFKEGIADFTNYANEKKECDEKVCKISITYKIPENPKEDYKETHKLKDLEVVYIEEKEFETQKIAIKLPKEDIQEATVNISARFYKDENFLVDKIISFASEKDKQELTIPLMGDVEVKKAEMELLGEEQFGKVDLLFVVDTSWSMNNEWSTLCEIMEKTINNLKSGGIDIQAKTYGLAGEQFQSKPCQQDRITEEQLRQAMPEGTYFFPGPPPAAYDTTDEAWGVGIIWLAENYKWRPHAKRVIFAISDSDPTGGGGVESLVLKSGAVMLAGEGKFSGNEEAVIKKAEKVAKEKEVSVYLIYGDEEELDEDKQKFPEGYHMGSDKCETDYKDTCGKILAWMKELAKETGGDVEGYKNTQKLAEKVSSVVKMLVENLQLDILNSGNDIDWQHPGPLDKKETIDLTKEFQEYVENNRGKDYLLIPIKFTPGSSGGLKINKIQVVYTRHIKGVKVDIAETTVLDKDFDKQAPPEKINFLDISKSFLEACREEECELPIKVSVKSPGMVIFNNLHIQYDSCLLKSKLLSNTLACWDKAFLGKSNKDVLCYELVLPKECITSEKISEEGLTKLLIQNNLCDIFGNSDFGCGKEDNLQFDIAGLEEEKNLLIAYNSNSKKVVVS